MPTSDSPTLGGSHGPGVGSRCSGNKMMPPTSSTTITGALIKNTEPHQKCTGFTSPRRQIRDQPTRSPGVNSCSRRK